MVLPAQIIPLSFVDLIMNPIKKSAIGSVLLLTSLAIYYEFGSDNFKSKDANDEEE